MFTVKQRYAPHMENIPYLTLPLKTDFQISQGYIYSQYETNIRKRYFHKGIDYTCSYHTPVYASASGYAVAGYHRFTEVNKDNTLKLYKGLPMGNGFGYFIQIYHPYSVCKVKGGRITQYGHLSKFAKGFKVKTFKTLVIDFDYEIRRKNNRKKSKKKDSDILERNIQETLNIVKQYPWVKKLYGYSFRKYPNRRELYTYTLRDIKRMSEEGNRYIEWVKQGDLIGYTGSSGIVWGDLKFKENCKKPNVKPFDTWDDIHLHFEEAGRNINTGIKVEERDPYNIYLSKEHYKNIKGDTLFIEERQRKLW